MLKSIDTMDSDSTVQALLFLSVLSIHVHVVVTSVVHNNDTSTQ